MERVAGLQPPGVQVVEEAPDQVAAVLGAAEDKMPAALRARLPLIRPCGRVRPSAVRAPRPIPLLAVAVPVQADQVHRFRRTAVAARRVPVGKHRSAWAINSLSVRARRTSVTLADLISSARPESLRKEPWFGTVRN